MKKKKILITGLTLCGNKGGAALALSFIEGIKKYISADFIFAVNSNNINLEKKWANRYKINVIAGDTIFDLFFTIMPFLYLINFIKNKNSIGSLRNIFKSKKKIHNEYIDLIKNVDCIININGIAFVGDVTRSWLVSFIERTSSIYSKLYKKPFFRFIQSYGPFNDWRVKLLAKMEFSNLDMIMARGKSSAKYCESITKNKPIYSFPDVALILPSSNKNWLNKYLNKFNLKQNKYIVLSPSAAITNISEKRGSSLGKKHIQVYLNIAKHFILKNKKILFVPHSTSLIKSSCDREVCKKILLELKKENIDTSNCFILDDDLDCLQLKAIISKSKFAIISRYHALVAALSSNTPAISIGWNEKYIDLMTFYNCPKYAIDSRMMEPKELSKIIIDITNNLTKENKVSLNKCNIYLKKEVDRALKICADWILSVSN